MLAPEVIILLAARVSGAVLAILLARTGFRAYRAVPSKTLLTFSAGFAGFAMAQAVATVTEILAATAPAIPRTGFDVFDVLFWSYYASLLGAVALLIASVGRRHLRWVAAMGPLMLIAGPVFQLLAIAGLFLLVLNLGLNHIEHPRTGSFRTAFGFFLLFAGHFLFLFDYAPLTPRNLPGEIVGLVGFALLHAAARQASGGA